MLARKSKLSRPVLRSLRKRWSSAVAAALDELSILTPQSFFQIDCRSREATEQPHASFGGLLMLACVDFLQLPPVDKPSIAISPDVDGYLDGFDEKDTAGDGTGAKQKKQRAEFEHRQGCDIWRHEFFNVTSFP